jgi:hypothetical protein
LSTAIPVPIAASRNLAFANRFLHAARSEFGDVSEHRNECLFSCAYFRVTQLRPLVARFCDPRTQALE